MDDDQKLQKLLEEAYAKAPKPVQEFVDSGALEAFLNRLPNDFDLTQEQAAAAAREIALGVLGLTVPQELHSYLSAYAKVPASSMERLIAALDESIFAPLKKKMTGAISVPISRPPAPVAPTPPINRLAGKGVPPPLLRKMDTTTPSPAPVVPQPVPHIGVPVIQAVPPPPQRTVIPPAPVAIPVPKPVPPPLVAPVPSSVVDKKPSVAPTPAPSPIKKTDPYREAIE